MAETSALRGIKQQLHRLLTVILEEEEDCSIEMETQAIRILSRLMEMRLNQSLGLGAVSGSGQDQILRWCEEHGVSPPPKVDRDIDEQMTDRCHTLLVKLYSLLSDQKEAAKELHRLTKTMPSCRAVFSEIPDGITRLLSPLAATRIDFDPELQEDLIATLLNISTVDNNKKLVAEHPAVIPLLAASMSSGTTATRRNAAATLYTLSTLDSNKHIIGNSGALEPLLELLRVGHPLAVKDAVSAIFSLCHVHENRVKFTEIGAVKVIIHKLNGGILVHELLGILALLSRHQGAVDDLKDPTTFPRFIQIITKNRSELANKPIDTILHNVSMSPVKKKVSTLKALAEDGHQGTE